MRDITEFLYYGENIKELIDHYTSNLNMTRLSTITKKGPRK